jgi:hypothetical protein
MSKKNNVENFLKKCYKRLQFDVKKSLKPLDPIPLTANVIKNHMAVRILVKDYIQFFSEGIY